MPWIVAVVAAVVVSSCATVEPPRDRPFSRTDLLVDAIEERLNGEEPAHAINLIGRGLEHELLTADQGAAYVERLGAVELRRYREALADREYRRAVQSIRNITVLSSASVATAEDLLSEDLLSEDQILLEWAQHHLDNGEPVLALYTLLRRSTVGDLSADTLDAFVVVARDLNHDEALARLLRVADERSIALTQGAGHGDDDGDSAAEMLGGTVTVWVNRGIRLQQGVGVPDRVIGSGFFVDPRGYLLTNYHVISSEVDPEYEGYSRLFIKLPGRPDERVPARVIGYDRIFDLALLKVEIDPAYVFSLSDTRELEPGEAVLALGSPGGLDSTVTSGIVSAAGRRFLQMGEAVQVDVPINPGNSGGPLILPDGQVAGVVFSGVEQFEGVNFAIPAYWIRHFFPRLYDDGEVTHAWMGTSVFASADGLHVVYVAPESPADDAGVRPGDLLTAMNGRTVTSLAEAQDILLALNDGAILETTWETRTADDEMVSRRRLIALTERPFSPVEEALKRQPIEDLFPVLYGMDVDHVSAAPWGPDFVITDVLPGSIADESSLSVDDPFALRDWRVDRDLRAAFIRIIIKKRKAGFLESGVQLGAFLETDSFL